MSYIELIKEKARQDKKTIVLPECTDRRTLIAASHIMEEGVANLILIGNEEKIMDGAGWLEVDLPVVRLWILRLQTNSITMLNYYMKQEKQKA